ncbi:M35 family metallo-endopeptidase [Mesorhizobium sp. M1066]|uniref:M35 family metallo-endopeptidase n=1 Tax=unclassified Mesorhizobium TaxID=325217 RepID=UPI0033385879
MRISSEFAVLLGIALVAAGSAKAGIDEQKKPCSAAQTAALDSAVSGSKAGLVKAVESLKSPKLPDEQRIVTWFGAGTPNEIAAIRSVYETALTFSGITNYWCPNNSIPELVWDVGDMAAVTPAAPGAMFFTPDFFALSPTGQDSQQGTIVHELSHLSGATLRPEVYQPGPAKALAASNPADAQKNGDSFQYYYENLIFGAP